MAKKTSAIAPRKRPQQKRSTEMVDRILKAALTLIKANGIENTSTIAIASLAGMSAGSLYQYYPNKEAIILDIAKNWLSSFPANIPIASAQNPSWDDFRETIGIFVNDLGTLYKDYAFVLPIVNAMYSMPALAPVVAGHDARIVSLHAAWLRSINPDLPPAAASRLGLMMLEIGHACLSAGVNRPPREFKLMLRDLEAVHLALLQPHLALR